MDLSDGLADAVRQLAEAAGTGAAIQAEIIPVDPAARAWWTSRGEDAATRGLIGGEDYELLFAVPPRRRRAAASACARSHVALTRIGSLTTAGLTIRLGENEIAWPDGYAHFANNSI